ncbi:hypothetical protein QWY99_17775 [Flavobacterium branchiarum]|nr:hypothetical protein [Flavobacterium branchiarum]MDN3674891.1 hypothetical protein [Flavobacterium branchiarum]
MKKLVFTALAVVAFSGVSMANTNNIESEMDSSFLVGDYCIGVYHATYIEFASQGFDYDAPGEAWAAYKECMGH